MAPLPNDANPIPPNTVTAILTHLPKTKRSAYCEYRNTSCDTQRTVVLIIVILVGAFVALVFSLLYMRARKRKIARAKAAKVAQRQRKLADPFQGVTYEAPPPYMPPPYMPREPESTAKLDARAV